MIKLKEIARNKDSLTAPLVTVFLYSKSFADILSSNYSLFTNIMIYESLSKSCMALRFLIYIRDSI